MGQWVDYGSRSSRWSGPIAAAKVLGLGAFLVLLPFGCRAGCKSGAQYQVADGFRDSTIRRVSNTGLIWKTWEVESLGDGFRFKEGAASPETFQYTVDAPGVIEQLQSFPSGTKARIHYRKMLTIWSPDGESQYRITKIEMVN